MPAGVLDIGAAPRFAMSDEDRRARTAGRRSDGHGPLLRALGLAARGPPAATTPIASTASRMSSTLRLLIDLRRLDIPLEDAARIAGWCHSGHCVDTTSELPRLIDARRADIADRIAGARRHSTRALPGSRGTSSDHAGLAVLDVAGPCCEAADAVVGVRGRSLRLLLAGRGRGELIADRPDAVVATIIVGSGLRYISTDLFRRRPRSTTRGSATRTSPTRSSCRRPRPRLCRRVLALDRGTMG